MVTVNWLVAVPFAAWSWSMLSSNVLRALPAFNVISYHIHYDSFSVIWGAKPICLNPQILEMFPCKIASCKKKSDHQKNSKWLTQPVYLFPLMRLVKFEWTSQDNDVTISGDYRNRSKTKNNNNLPCVLIPNYYCNTDMNCATPWCEPEFTSCHLTSCHFEWRITNLSSLLQYYTLLELWKGVCVCWGAGVVVSASVCKREREREFVVL